jgi:hypothetical protein
LAGDRISAKLLASEVRMMTDPAFAIKRQVEDLVETQIDALGKRSSLSSSDLDECHARSEKISVLYRELDTIKRNRFNDLHCRQKAS